MSNITSKIDDENFTDNLEIDRIYEYGLYNPRFRSDVADDADLLVYNLGGDVGVTFESLNGDLGRSNIQFVEAGISKPKFSSESFKVGHLLEVIFMALIFQIATMKRSFHKIQLRQKTTMLFLQKDIL